MKAISVPCPGCDRTLDTFQFTAQTDRTVKLRATCHPCRQILELVITYDDLTSLAEGREIALSSVNPPYLM